MLLSKETTIKINDIESNIISHMNYAACKLWNVCNYEKHNYKTLGLSQFPDWYYQKKTHKSNIWYKSLPSQTAQEVCKQLQQSWKSFFKLQKTGGIKNPKPPKFKHDNMPITYMQNGIKKTNNSTLRLTLPKGLKKHMAEKYNIHDKYLFLKTSVFKDMNVKQIKIYPPKDSIVRVIFVYEVEDLDMLPDNGKYLSVDLGIKNPFTCYENINGQCLIFGKKYSSITYYFNNQIAYYQSINASQQAASGVKYPKISNKVKSLYAKKRNTLDDYFHKCTKAIVDYCLDNDIHTVVIGDITGIRENNDHGHVKNQTFHAFPKEKIINQLRYKLSLRGITLIEQKECYSSQCSPLAPKVSKEHAVKDNRQRRGLYMDNNCVWNADCVGAYNILRLYYQSQGKSADFTYEHLSNPIKIRV